MKYAGWPVNDVVEIHRGTLVLVGRIYEWSDGSRRLMKLFSPEKTVFDDKTGGLIKRPSHDNRGSDGPGRIDERSE